MTDRYANGDTVERPAAASRAARANTGYDPTDTGYYHGGDLKGLTGDCTDTKHGLARIKDLGFTAIWVTPPFGQRRAGRQRRLPRLLDPRLHEGRPAPRQRGDFGAFVDCAHRLGLKVLLDVVVNHTADVVQLSGGTSYSSRRRPYRDCRGKSFNPATYVTRSTFPCLKAANMPRPPFVLDGGEERQGARLAERSTNYHDRGDIDFGSCSQACFEQGDFFGLDDLFTEKPVVLNGLAQVYGDWIRRFKIDGFRIDTARHVNSAFFRLWVPKIRAAAARPGC